MTRCGAGRAACVDADVALAFADGALPAAQRADVEDCIDRCATCRAAVAAAARAERSAVATLVERPAGGRVSQAPPVGEQSALRPGVTVGRYVVERALGAGGMGVVSLARDPELRRAVVIKLVRPDAFDGEGESGLEVRLRREAQAMAQLSHPNVVQIFDIGRHGDRVFLAMEYVAGDTLDAWLIERPRSVDEILAIFLQAGAGLDAAHRAGLLHRDFKPTNVLVDRHGRAKVTDFGLARALGGAATRATGQVPPPQQPQLPQLSGVHAVLTQANAVIGTPAYMAPEQLAGRPLDARTDQYAFALALLDALVGQPAARRTVEPTLAADVLDAALAKPGVAPRARQAIVRALRPDPAARFPELGALLRELAPAPRERRAWPLVAGLALALAAGTTTFVALRRDDAPPACTADAPRAWTGELRARVVAALAADPRPFAAWHAERVATAIDRAVAELAAAEVARCEGTPTLADACIARRRAALATAGDLAATPPPADPWPRVHAIARCEEVDASRAGELAALRAELSPTLAAARASEIAERANVLQDDLLRADALAHAGRVAAAAGDHAAAGAAFLAQATTGERAGDDAARARALLGVLDVARLRGDPVVAHQTADQLRAMLARHADHPRDRLAIALTEAAAFTELGDARPAFAAIERAAAAAAALATADATLAVRITRAWALSVLRWDHDGARAELETALAAAAGSSPALRAEAHAVAGELALARRDGRAATAAFAEAHRLDPARVGTVIDRLRVARARGLTGDVEGALAATRALPTSDPTSAVRAGLARMAILHAAGRHDEAAAEAKAALDRLRSARYDATHYALSAYERIDAGLTRCDIEVARRTFGYCLDVTWLDALPKTAPLHARRHLQELAEARAAGRTTVVALYLEKALAVLVANDAAPVLLANLRWELARADEHRRALALAARQVFAGNGRLADVAAIDAWLATVGGPAPAADPRTALDDAPPPPPDAARPPTGDPWAP